MMRSLVRVGTLLAACTLSPIALAAEEVLDPALHLEWQAFVRLLETEHYVPVEARQLERACLNAIKARAAEENHWEACYRGAAKDLGAEVNYLSATYLRTKFLAHGHAGLELKKRGPLGSVRVTATRALSPDPKTQALPGDEVLEIDGVQVTNKPISEVLELSQGTVGSSAQIKVFRDGKELLVNAQRERRGLPDISSAPLRGDVLYVRVRQFANETAEQLSQALAPGNSNAQPPRRLILDLRGCAGGALKEILSASSLLLPEGSVVGHTRTRAADETLMTGRHPVSSKNQPRRAALDALLTVPLTVLVDAETAAGAELLALALRDHRRARIVGERTAGIAGLRQLQSFHPYGAILLRTGTLLSSRKVSWERIGIPLDRETKHSDGPIYGDLAQDPLLVTELQF